MLRYFLISFLITDLFFAVNGCHSLPILLDFTQLGVDFVEPHWNRTGQYIAIIGGTRDHKRLNPRPSSEVEVIRISDEGVVFTHLSNCNIPELKVQYATVSNNMICGGETPDTTNQCQELNPEAIQWKERSSMNVKRSGHAMTTVNNQTTYACGGYNDSITELKSCERMDGEWSSPLCGSYEYLKSCEKFNGEWSFIKDLPDSKRFKRFRSHCMIGTEDFLYLMGGDDGSLYKYDIKNDEWEDTNHPMSLNGSNGMWEHRIWHSCLLLNKEILVAGGTGTTYTSIFNLQSNTWRLGPDLPTTIYGSQLVKAQPSSQYAAFFIGGGYNDAYTDIYGLTKDFKSLAKIGDLKTARINHVAMVLPDKVVEKCVD